METERNEGNMDMGMENVNSTANGKLISYKDFLVNPMGLQEEEVVGLEIDEHSLIPEDELYDREEKEDYHLERRRLSILVLLSKSLGKNMKNGANHERLL